MADHDGREPDDSADTWAKWTFIATVTLAVLYVGTVFVFIMMR